VPSSQNSCYMSDKGCDDVANKRHKIYTWVNDVIVIMQVPMSPSARPQDEVIP
jgi:hypothetical protein